MKRVDANSFIIERKGGMNVDIRLYLPPTEKPDEAVTERLKNAAGFPSVIRVIGLPNLGAEGAFASGCVVAATDIIVPEIIGEDINGGTRLISIPVEAGNMHMRRIEKAVRSAVPFGERSVNLRMNEGGFRLLLEFGIAGLADVTNRSERFWRARIEPEEESDARRTEESGSMLTSSSVLSHHAIERAQNQLGSVGGAGHFIELLAVEGVFDKTAARELGISKDQLIIAFDAGSRSLGYQVCEEFSRLAKEMNVGRSQGRGLSYFEAESPSAEAYLQAVSCASNFAFVNRQIITALLREAVREVVGKKAMPLIADIRHTTLKSEEHGKRRMWIHRRGATGFTPKDGASSRDTGRIALVSGAPSGASYIISAGTDCDSTLYSVSSNSGYDISPDKNRNTLSPRRNVDEVVRCLVDSGLARIIARMKSLFVTGK